MGIKNPGDQRDRLAQCGDVVPLLGAQRDACKVLRLAIDPPDADVNFFA
jgi:hypothetical protein